MKTTTSTRLPVLAGLSAVLLSTLAVSCASGATCDDDERLRAGLCLPKGSGTKDEAAAEPDAGGDGAATDGAPAKTGAFGDSCTTNDDCGEPAPVCAIQPTDAVGFCSQIDCGGDPSICPSGWTCFDPSVINPDWPTICVAE